ncbi:hypothetical protein JMF94_00220 [Desulfovibrio sp. UIB00]|uniref:hypothetical protein n=1 Tax=Desulfovibrio sp. UIB00 TaxID=2804314 RepID=UPI001F0D09E7|nr:hypothetical protein [Desulfovibrio sp. UIB00]MCH5143505.1 hypothetical protein [Desulfovibrio sp. UIB00]
MTFPTCAEIKTGMRAGWKEYWPVFITLLFTYLGWLSLCKDDGYFFQLIGAVGVMLFLPLFKLQKNIWLYVTVFFLSGAGKIWPEGTQWITTFTGFEKITAWTASTAIISVQGAAVSFVCLLLVHVFIFRLQGRASLLFKVPICVFFLLAALIPAFFFLWLLLSVTGIFGPHVL